MGKSKAKALKLDRSTLEVRLDYEQARKWWFERLTRVGSEFARLFFLSTLRDAESSRYFEARLAERTSVDCCHRVLLESHINTFRQWLALPTQRKIEDL